MYCGVKRRTQTRGAWFSMSAKHFQSSNVVENSRERPLLSKI